MDRYFESITFMPFKAKYSMKNTLLLFVTLLLIFSYSCDTKTSKQLDSNIEIEHITQERPTQKGQKFMIDYGEKQILTVDYFFGGSGIPYSTYEEAIKNNPDGKIYVNNVEYGGTSAWEDGFLLASESDQVVTLPALHENYETNQKVVLRLWHLLKNRKFENITSLLLSPDQFEATNARFIDNQLDKDKRIVWGFHHKRLNQDEVRYNLFGYEPVFNSTENPIPLIEFDFVIDNQQSPEKIASFNILTNDDINEDIFLQGNRVSPETMPERDLAFLNTRSLDSVIDSIEKANSSPSSTSYIADIKILKESIQKKQPLDERVFNRILIDAPNKESFFKGRLLLFSYNFARNSRSMSNFAEENGYYLEDFLTEQIDSRKVNTSYTTFYPLHTEKELLKLLEIRPFPKTAIELSRNSIGEAEFDKAINILLSINPPERVKEELLFLKDADEWLESLTPMIKAGKIKYSLYSEMHAGISARLLDLM